MNLNKLKGCVPTHFLKKSHFNFFNPLTPILMDTLLNIGSVYYIKYYKANSKFFNH